MGYGIPNFNKAYAWLLQNKKPNTSIALYPNPCYDRLTLEWYNPDREEVGITCTTLTGQVVFRTRMHENQKITFTHEIQSLNPGIYFIHLAGRYGADYIKFIKQ
jgi:hypothetical protein